MADKPKLYIRHLAKPYQTYEVLSFNKETKMATLRRTNPQHEQYTTFESPITKDTFSKYQYEMYQVNADGVKTKLR